MPEINAESRHSDTTRHQLPLHIPRLRLSACDSLICEQSTSLRCDIATVSDQEVMSPSSSKGSRMVPMSPIYHSSIQVSKWIVLEDERRDQNIECIRGGKFEYSGGRRVTAK